MSNYFQNSPDFIVSNEILFQTERFTSENIISTLSSNLNDFFKTLDEIKIFVEYKISNLIDTGLISYTGINYYVN